MSDHIETICVQGGYRPGNGEPRQVPIIQSTTFKYESSADMRVRLLGIVAEGVGQGQQLRGHPVSPSLAERLHVG